MKLLRVLKELKTCCSILTFSRRYGIERHILLSILRYWSSIATFVKAIMIGGWGQIRTAKPQFHSSKIKAVLAFVD